MFKFISFIIVASWALSSQAQGGPLKALEIREAVKFLEFFEANSAQDTQKYYDLYSHKNRDSNGNLWTIPKVSGDLALIKNGSTGTIYIPEFGDKENLCSGVATQFAGGNQRAFVPVDASAAKEILRSARNYRRMLTSYTMNRLYHSTKTGSGEDAALLEVLAIPESHTYILVYKSPKTDHVVGFELVAFGKSNNVIFSNSAATYEAEKEMQSNGAIVKYLKCL